MTERQAALTGYHEYELRLKGFERQMQERWTVARWICWQQHLLSPNIKPGNKAKTAQAFCRFPWEQSEAEELAEKAKFYRITPEEEAELNRIMAEYEAAKNKKENHE